MSNKTTYLKDYQPPVYSVTSIALDFSLHQDYARVESLMHLKREHPGALRLNGCELELISIEMDGRLLQSSDYIIDEGDLLIENCPDETVLKIICDIYPQNNTALSGLFRTHLLFCTQCEAEGFRRITFFPDRPDVLTLFTTRISADKKTYPTLLSNGNLIDSGDLPEGRHWALWQDPFKKPSYLFALVAGNLAVVKDVFITQSGRTVDLSIFVEPGNEQKCAHAMASIKKAMRWDEEVYGREYDLSVFMIVAVSDFNMGAMENKGLNIFNAKYILVSPETATDNDFMAVESVVAHEYFHNWTGNRITCRDWFQLSLKEGLTVFRDQEFSRDMNSRAVNRIQDVNVLRSSQFPEDAGSMAHPVRPEAYQEINNFYTATIYNKGAEVIRMQQTLLGNEGFRRGMDRYFSVYDGQAVTIDDFVNAMEVANQVDFTQFKRWYTQAGTPQVAVESHYADKTLTLTMTQSCRETPESAVKLPFHIPIRIALFNDEGMPIPLAQTVLELREETQKFTFSGIEWKPIVSLLGDFSAPIKLKQALTPTEQLALLGVATDGYIKWNAAQQLACDTIIAFYNHGNQPIAPVLITAFKTILQDTLLDKALRAQLITPPRFEEIISDLMAVDVSRLEAARDNYHTQLGQALFDDAELMYKQLTVDADMATDGEAFSRRKLRNLCLWLMMKGDEQRALSLCIAQFNTALTMTDKLASFAMLTNCQSETIREVAIEDFYQQWQADELVMDKWFAIQAMSDAPDTLKRVKELLSHPAFILKNPNKVRALIGSFSQNPRYFHHEDGSGYALLAKIIAEVDVINPQIAARLATPFTRSQQFDAIRVHEMQMQLGVLNTHECSRDLAEVISKSLI